MWKLIVYLAPVHLALMLAFIKWTWGKKGCCVFIFRTACIMALPLDLIITFIIGWKIFLIFS